MCGKEILRTECTLSYNIVIFSQNCTNFEDENPKRMKLLKIIILGVALLLTASCGTREIDDKLEEAQAIVAVAPDSALALLSEIQDASELAGEERLRYTLLRTMALDGIGATTDNDSAMQRVVIHYSSSNDAELHFLSLYTLGRIYRRCGYNAKAMLNYVGAEHIMGKIESPANAGLLYMAMADIFADSFDYTRTLDAYQKAHLYFRVAEANQLQHKALVSVAQTLMEQKKYDEAERYLLDELQWAYDNSHKDICQSTVENLLILYHRTNYPSKSDWLLGSEYFTLCDSTLIVDRAIAYMHALSGDYKASDRFIRRAWAKSHSISDTLANLVQMYDISRMSGRYSEALDILENVHYIHDTIMRSALQQPVMLAQRDFYRSQAELGDYRLAAAKRLSVAIFVAAVLFLVVILLFIKNRMAAQNAEIERYMELADEIGKTLYAKNAEVADISLQLEANNRRLAEMDKQVGTLFKKQFAMLDELSGTFYETHGIKKDKDAIYRQVRENIEAFMKDKRSAESLEAIVNDYRGGIMRLLRSELPQLGEAELRFLVFVYAGFSSKAISIFMQDTVGNVYTKKSRLKSLILRSEAPHKQQFIDAMS